MKALRLPIHKELVPGNFPNIHKVANMRRRKIDEAFHDCQSNKETMSQLTDLEIEKAIQESSLESTDKV